MQLILWVILAAGHIGIWCAIFNRTHATAWPRAWRKLIERIIILLTGAPLIAVPAWAIANHVWTVPELADNSILLAAWIVLCEITFCFFLVNWLFRLTSHRRPKNMRHMGTEHLLPEKELGLKLTTGSLASLLRMIPGNQVVQLSIEKYEIDLASDSAANQELRVAHLTDLHFTGLVRREYFEYAIQKTNEFNPDIVFVTGDIIDEPKCLDWIGQVFSELCPKFGTYYVLGNHDRRIRDEQLLRRHLHGAGLIQASGKWHKLTIRGSKLAISGNDLPWYRDAARLPKFEPDNPTPCTRILLAHSPDQFDWAVQRGFDLVFAGHTHGGQIRLPLIGPIIAPSRHGVRFAAGDFQQGGTMMHVSRGISGDDPVRLRCPPELGLFVLKVPAGDAGLD